MTAYKFIPLITLCILVAATNFGQGKDAKALALEKIKKAYYQISGYKNYRIVTIENTENFLGHNTDNGGTLTGYYKADSLKKIEEWVGLSNRVLQNEYYFEDNKLIFVYTIESSYNYDTNTQSFDYSKLYNVFKGRYYFYNNELLETILNDKEHIKTKQKDALNFLMASNNYTKLLMVKLR